MKRILCAALFALLLVGCGGADKPEKVVEECWERLSKGDVKGAVELMNVQPEEVEIYCAAYAEQCGELQATGGMDDFEVVGISQGESDATVEAIVTLKDGQQITATYNLVKSGKQWLLAE